MKIQPHAQAFARIEEISQVLRSVPAPSASSARRVARDRYDASVPIKDWNRPRALPGGVGTAIAVAASVRHRLADGCILEDAAAEANNTFADRHRGTPQRHAQRRLNHSPQVPTPRSTVALAENERRIHAELTKGMRRMFTVAKDADPTVQSTHAGDATISS